MYTRNACSFFSSLICQSNYVVIWNVTYYSKWIYSLISESIHRREKKIESSKQCEQLLGPKNIRFDDESYQVLSAHSVTELLGEWTYKMLVIYMLMLIAVDFQVRNIWNINDTRSLLITVSFFYYPKFVVLCWHLGKKQMKKQMNYSVHFDCIKIFCQVE